MPNNNTIFYTDYPMSTPMTVQELIDELSKLDPKMDVMILADLILKIGSGRAHNPNPHEAIYLGYDSDSDYYDDSDSDYYDDSDSDV